MAAAGNIQQTVLNGPVICGVPTNIIWNQATQAKRIATDVFNNDFNTWLDKTFAQIDDNWKTYSSFTVANGQIRVNPQVKRNVRAFVQWCRDKIRVCRNPADTPFPVAHSTELISNGVIVPLERIQRLNRSNLQRVLNGLNGRLLSSIFSALNPDAMASP